MDYKFYDTCSLLLKADNLFEDNEQFAISSITLNELEYIKTSNNKDPEIKCAARHLLKQLDQGGYDIVYFKEEYLKPIQDYGYEITNDIKIRLSIIFVVAKLYLISTFKRKLLKFINLFLR